MRINLLIAWIGILLGFTSGLVMGLCFHREDWLGGYGSFKRRLYRLAHISFFGLGAVNLLFYLTAHALAAGAMISLASSLFVIGAITMPVCCVIMAHFPKTQMLFAVPVLSLMAAGALTVLEVAKFQGKTTNIEQPTTNIQGQEHRLKIIGCSVFDVGCWMFPHSSHQSSTLIHL